ncbi:MAG: hypothetical protein FXF47_02710 [Candidatus Mcinerneyibacterium aminivorans]|uniref:PorV/PorQ family protein n=1 Tax=Candidatus Mcinerneyibacterium aminivorans TaxID=2703815 RepID=A0A5D0MJT8_9BACT|nr:MAG: hypothetical protein FXF47_02710 [Candidatus Mcinerneyibacterium aminivorans]
MIREVIMKKILFLIIFIFFLQIVTYSFPVMGARSMGMGGAGIASTLDASAVYWNPAAMSFIENNLVTAKIDFGIDIMQNMSEKITEFNNLDSEYEEFLYSIENTTLWNSQENIEEFKNFYNKYSDKFMEFDNGGVGTNMDLAGGFFFNIKGTPYVNLSLGITALSDIQFYSRTADVSILRTIPLDYLSMENILGTSNYTQAQAEDAFNNIILPILNELNSGNSVFSGDERQYLENYLYIKYVENPFNTYQNPDPENKIGIINNNSEVVVDGILLNEFIVSFSKSLEMDEIMGVAVGGNIKLIKGYNYSQVFMVEQFKDDETDNGEDNVFDQFNDPFEGSTAGLDLAAYMKIFEKLNVGLTIRNIIVGDISWDKKRRKGYS